MHFAEKAMRHVAKHADGGHAVDDGGFFPPHLPFPIVVENAVGPRRLEEERLTGVDVFVVVVAVVLATRDALVPVAVAVATPARTGASPTATCARAARAAR